MIFYFSSTGNSLTIAEGLAKVLGDSVMHISKAKKIRSISCKRVGFVYPVHNYNMPPMMQEFIKNVDISNAEYIFGIITHGGDKGNALYTLNELLQAKGKNLNYINDILMPVNSRIMYGMVTDKIEERTQNQNTIIESFVKDIENDVNNTVSLKKKGWFVLMNRLGESNYIKRKLTPTIDQNKCIGCNICVEVCPVNNITLNKSKAFINSNCENCMTCIHWCPQVSIGFGKRKVRKEQQYHHPKINIKDIISQLT